MNLHRRAAVFATMVLSGPLLLVPGVSRAKDWPGWRGSQGTGYADEKGLPLAWSAKTSQGILWKVPLQGTTGHSSPIVWGDRVLITTAVKQTAQEEQRKEIPDHHVACYRASDGKLLWKTRIAQGRFQEGYAIYAVPTPVTDGQAVYVWFGSGVIAALNLDGTLLWRHERPGPFNLNPGLCASPILYRDTVILPCDQGGGRGFLQGLDKKTGQVRWEQKRTKTGCSNTTPLLIEVKGKPQMILAASEELQGLDPATGRAIWWCRTPGFGESPVTAFGLVYTSKGGDEAAMLVDPTSEGDVAATHVKWKLPKAPGDYSSAVVAGDYLYFVQKEGIVGCRKFMSGEMVFTERLEGVSKLASPIATADGRIYFVSTGRSYVLKVGPRPEILGGGDLQGWGNGSSPAVSNGRIFVRDFENLWCIGKKQ
jgi:outer membrane protein assembly factor BamB